MTVMMIQVGSQSKKKVLGALERLLNPKQIPYTLVIGGTEGQGGVEVHYKPEPPKQEDLEVTDDQGDNSAHYAARTGTCQRLYQRLKYSSHVSIFSAENRFKVTPLHVAADSGNDNDVQV